MPRLTTSSHDQDDIAFLHRIVAGDHQAFERLYQQYTPRLTSYLQTFLGPHEPIEDVLHDVFLVVWQQASQYRATGRVSTWLFGIARNKALKARARITRSPLLSVPTPDPIDPVDPENIMTQEESSYRMQQALDTLSPMQREVLVLTYEQGYSVQEIATRLECSASTVHYRKQQAHRRLAIKLGLCPRDSSQPAPTGRVKADHASASLNP